MSEVDIRIAKRVATYMLEVAEQQVDLHFFMGLGFSLAVIYEEVTGLSAKNTKPKDLIQWAQALGSVTFPHVKSN
jgi:hypothetical protein